MTVKKDVAPLQVQKGKTTPENEVKASLPFEAKAQEPTAEELKKQITELQKKLSSIPQALDQRIEYFTKKQDLILKLGRLDTNHQNLSEHLDALAEIAAKNEFENEDYFLNIESGGKYSKKAIFSLQNPIIIGEVISFMLGRIDAKRQELKKEIEA